MNTITKYGTLTTAGPLSAFGMNDDAAMPSPQNTTDASTIVTTSGKMCAAGRWTLYPTTEKTMHTADSNADTMTALPMIPPINAQDGSGVPRIRLRIPASRCRVRVSARLRKHALITPYARTLGV